MAGKLGKPSSASARSSPHSVPCSAGVRCAVLTKSSKGIWSLASMPLLTSSCAAEVPALAMAATNSHTLQTHSGPLKPQHALMLCQMQTLYMACLRALLMHDKGREMGTVITWWKDRHRPNVVRTGPTLSGPPSSGLLPGAMPLERQCLLCLSLPASFPHGCQQA